MHGTIPLNEDKRIQFLSERTRRVLKHSENIDALFSVYQETHPRSDHLKPKFEYGLRYLLGNHVVELREKLSLKDWFGPRN